MNILRELRKSKKITMKELGCNIGVSESTISLYENGKRQPDYNTLKKISLFFNVSIDYLLNNPTHTHDKHLNSNESLFIKNFSKLNEVGQQNVLNYIDDLIASGKYKKGIAISKNA